MELFTLLVQDMEKLWHFHILHLQKSSYFQAFIISLATAFVHIVGAFILVLISVVVLQKCDE